LVQYLGIDTLFLGRGECAVEITHGEVCAVRVNQKLLQGLGKVTFLIEKIDPFVPGGAVNED
jgi:hypothetical protein